MHKRSFLLLELVIAFLLLTLCSSLFIGSPMKLIKRDFSFLEEIELQQHADNLFIEVKKQLYQNLISWKQLTDKEPYQSTFGSFTLQGISSRVWTPVVTIRTDQQKKGSQGEDFRLFLVSISFQGMKEAYVFSYKLFAQTSPQIKEDKKTLPNPT